VSGGALAVSAIAGAALAAWAALFWAALRVRRAVEDLPPAGGAPRGGWPSLSVIVPCRDEAAGVEEALASVLAQDYPGLEVVAVDDRSSDGTGRVLDAVAAARPALAVEHVTALPPGWLGKTHACEAGARRAHGAWLLFTDADVVLAPGALRAAVAHAEARGLGHLVVTPALVAPGFAERAFVSFFAALLAVGFRPAQLRRARTRAFAGVGAFNLVRAEAWRAVGGHRALAYEVADDVKLGLVLRRSGVPQGVAQGAGFLALRWQPGFRASLRGLVKNGFAGLEYRWGRVAGVAAALALLGAGPWVGVTAGPSGARAAGLAALAAAWLVHGGAARRSARGSGWEGACATGCALLLGGVLVASAALASARGAVVWRGTRYPLRELRAQCVRARDWPAERAVGWPAR
jgi:hypothetical protein